VVGVAQVLATDLGDPVGEKGAGVADSWVGSFSAWPYTEEDEA
jgi:hypothetical protein